MEILDGALARKTELGLHEMQNRSGRLTQGERRVLILADGRRSVGELNRFVRPGELAPILDKLMREGFVVMRDRGAPAVAASGVKPNLPKPGPARAEVAVPGPSAPPAAVAPEIPAANVTQQIARIATAIEVAEQRAAQVPGNAAKFETLKKQASRELLDRCGFFVELVAERVLASQSPRDLRLLLREVEPELNEHLGIAETREFAKRIGARAVELS
jgi:hypothetical protein